MSIKLQIITPGPAQGSLHVYMCAMVMDLMRRGIQVDIQNPRGSDLCAVRYEGLKKALASNPTHILWVDTDMVFPPHAAAKLLSHDKELVSVLIPVKDFRGAMSASTLDRKPLSEWGKTGLEEFTTNYHIGMGFLLHLAVLVAGAKPEELFGQRWAYNEDGPYSVFEDAHYCEYLARKTSLWIDHDLTTEIGHMGAIVWWPHPHGISLG